MATSGPTVTVNHPPREVLRVANALLIFALRTPLGGPLRTHYLTLSFTGRNTGRAYEFPVRVHRVDEVLYAITSAEWRLNFRDAAPARVAYNGRKALYYAELIEYPNSVSDLLVKLTDDYGPRRAQHKLGLKFLTDSPTRHDFIAAVQREHIAAVRLTRA